jgi:acid phosphatase (class B)
MLLQRFSIATLSIVFLCSPAFASDSAGVCDPARKPFLVKKITAEKIAEGLTGMPPMAVGFDVDETILFSSPVFYHLSQTLPDCEGMLEGCSVQPGYWEQANTLDTFSLPKPVGVELAKMHIARGDEVYFITARTGTDNETLSQVLRDLLDDQTLADVVFVGYVPGTNPKIEAIQERNIQIYYGDSDGDMRAAYAQEPPITGYRMLRSENTLENIYGVPTPGICGERVVKGSDL